MSTTETQALPAGTWAVDPAHSTIGLSVGYMVGSFAGTFSDFDVVGTDALLTGSAKLASVQVEDPNLEMYLPGNRARRSQPARGKVLRSEP
jgi:polyisoprenoid-binding protein YceI